MKNHTDLINYLLSLPKPAGSASEKPMSYLEIGTFNPEHNFNHIKADRKVSVDPDRNAKAIVWATSDDYFRLFGNERFDLIFIDGLHHCDQVRRDFNNALRHLNPGGFIVMHDCNPPTEKTTCVPRGAQREWCGDVYKFACNIRHDYTGVNYVTVDFDYGCGVAWMQPMRDITIPMLGSDDKLTKWSDFEKNRREWLRLVSVDEFLQISNDFESYIIN